MRDHATYTYLSTFLTYICTTQAYFGQPGYYQQGFQPRYPGVQQIQQGYGYGPPQNMQQQQQQPPPATTTAESFYYVA